MFGLIELSEAERRVTKPLVRRRFTLEVLDFESQRQRPLE